MSADELQMNAYYYGFDATGVMEIDRVLSAVAVAGKRFHHTEMWSDEDDGRPSCQERIQEAANESAAEIARLRAVLSALCDATDFASLGLRLGLSGTLARIPAWENDIERIDKARAVAVSVLQGEPQ